jgi:hypothetical protein
LKTELKLLNNFVLLILKTVYREKVLIVIKMNISKHFTKRFRLNFALNQSSQNAEHTYITAYFRNSLLYSYKSNNRLTTFGVLYKKYNKN